MCVLTFVCFRRIVFSYQCTSFPSLELTSILWSCLILCIHVNEIPNCIGYCLILFQYTFYKKYNIKFKDVIYARFLGKKYGNVWGKLVLDVFMTWKWHRYIATLNIAPERESTKTSYDLYRITLELTLHLCDDLMIHKPLLSLI